jgi:predicted alpha/beta-fold hydrolase
LKKDYPDSPISVVGFSLGGNLLLKLLGERGELMKETVTQAIAICPPIDLFFTCEAMNEGFNKIYQRYYINNLTKQSSQWIGSKRINTVYEYDEKVTAPFWGYANAIDYYYKCSSLRLLPQIRVPTHILFSADDPFIDYKPALNHENEFISIGLSEKGGHMGFYGGGGDNFWMDTLVLNWLKGDYMSNNL